MCDNMAVGVGLVHDEKNQSVSVGLDASAAGSNSTTSTHQTSCLFTAGQVTYSAFSKTVLKQQLSLPGKIFTVQPLQMAHALEIKFWVISSVCHNLFFNKKKRKGKSLICFYPSLQSASTRVTKSKTSAKRNTDRFKVKQYRK